jgi:hypothetical protein
LNRKRNESARKIRRKNDALDAARKCCQHIAALSDLLGAARIDSADEINLLSVNNAARMISEETERLEELIAVLEE